MYFRSGRTSLGLSYRKKLVIHNVLMSLYLLGHIEKCSGEIRLHKVSLRQRERKSKESLLTLILKITKKEKKKKGSISVCYTLKRYSCNTGVNIMKLLKYTSQLLPYYVHQPWHSMFLLHVSIFFIAIFILFPPLLLATVFPSVIFSVSAYMCTHSGKGTDFPKDLEIFRFP